MPLLKYSPGLSAYWYSCHVHELESNTMETNSLYSTIHNVATVVFKSLIIKAHY